MGVDDIEGTCRVSLAWGPVELWALFPWGWGVLLEMQTPQWEQGEDGRVQADYFCPARESPWDLSTQRVGIVGRARWTKTLLVCALSLVSGPYFYLFAVEVKATMWVTYIPTLFYNDRFSTSKSFWNDLIYEKKKDKGLLASVTLCYCSPSGPWLLTEKKGGWLDCLIPELLQILCAGIALPRAPKVLLAL